METEIITTIIILLISVTVSIVLLLKREYRTRRPQDKNKKPRQEKEEETEEEEEDEQEYLYVDGLNVGRIISKIIATIMAMYIANTIVGVIGEAMNGTTSGMYTSLRLIGWQITEQGTIIGTSGAGIITAIGIFGLTSIVLEIVKANRWGD